MREMRVVIGSILDQPAEVDEWSAWVRRCPPKPRIIGTWTANEDVDETDARRGEVMTGRRPVISAVPVPARRVGTAHSATRIDSS